MSETTNTIPSLEEARAGAAASSAALADAKAQAEASSAALAAAQAKLAAAKNPPAPASDAQLTPVAVGSNADIDKAFNEGSPDLEGVTIKDGMYMMPDGVTTLKTVGPTPTPAPASNMLYGSNAAKESNAPVMRLPSSGGTFTGNALIYFPNGDIVNVQQGIAEANLNHAKNTGVVINSRDDYTNFVKNLSSKSGDPFSIEAAVVKQGADLNQKIVAELKGKTPEEIAALAKEYNEDNLLTIKDVGTAVAAPLPEDFDAQIFAINAAQAEGNLDKAQNLLNNLTGQANIPEPSASTPADTSPTPTPTPTPAPLPPAFAEGVTTTPTPPASSTTTPVAPTPPALIPTTPTPTITTPTIPSVAPTVTGTMAAPVQTAGLSAVPSTIQVNPNVTGTNMANLTLQSQQGFGGVKRYRNAYTGLEIDISVDGQGNPLTMVPPGYTQIQGQSEGGSVSEASPDVQLARKFLGFNGPSSQLENFLNSSPALAARMGKYRQAMASMSPTRMGANTGTDVSSVNPATGALLYGKDPATGGTSLEQFQKMQQNLITQTMQPIPALVGQIKPETADFISTTAGQTSAAAPMPNVATVGSVQQAAMPTATIPSTMTAQTAATDVATEAAKFTPQVGTIQPGAVIPAQQQLTTSVSGMEAAQGTATMVNAPAPREIQKGEIIDIANDVAGQAQKAATFNEQIQAATATPSKQATVAGQLEGLMAQFEGGNTPSWAAGAMRAATATMAARGLGASSMAGQAIVQAAMESALPIAQMDASVMAQFEAQNLSNRQQRAILAAQQRAQFLGQEFDQAFQARVQNSARIGDIANLNFTAEQQIALEDSRAANTVNLSNLSNNQALVMAEAAALSQLDTQNLNNRQQTAVQNAQNFLQMDMTNLANTQQTELFKAQQNIQALFTDQAARNAAEQFNATSENQTNQFFANLSTQTSQFNAAQQNAMDQFNVNTTNAMRQFNSEVQQQRDLFNAQNGLVIAQANAQWRQNLATVNNAAINQANMDFAKTINAMSMKNLDEIWQRERDIMSFAFTSDQSAMDRALKIILGDKDLEKARLQLDKAEDAADTELAMRFLFGTSPTGILGGLL